MNYPHPTPPQRHNDGLPFALPPVVKTRTGVSAVSVLLGVTSVMGLFQLISVQVKYGMGLDPLGSLMSYSGYAIGILGALLLWVLRPAKENQNPYPAPGQVGFTSAATPPPAAVFPVPAPAPQPPAEIAPPAPPVIGGPTAAAGYNYAQFDDLLGRRPENQ